MVQETNARKLWLKLESLFEKKTLENKISFFKSLTNMRYIKGMSMIKHVSNFQGLLNQLCAMDVRLDDEVKATMLLSSLPSEWETFVWSVCDYAPNSVLSMEFVKGKMFEEETRKMSGLSLSRESSSDDNGRENRRRNQSRGWRNQSRSRGRSQVNDKRRCYHCGKEGHIRRQCSVCLREQRQVQNRM